MSAAAHSDLRPGARILCADGQRGNVLILRRTSNAALIFVPALRTWRWVDATKIQPARREAQP